MSNNAVRNQRRSPVRFPLPENDTLWEQSEFEMEQFEKSMLSDSLFEEYHNFINIDGFLRGVWE